LAVRILLPGDTGRLAALQRASHDAQHLTAFAGFDAA